MDQQQQMIGSHVDELTLYIGPVKDSGRREVFVNLQCGNKRHQARKTVADWVATDGLVGWIAVIVFDVEKGAVRPWELGVALESVLDVAEAHPF